MLFQCPSERSIRFIVEDIQNAVFIDITGDDIRKVTTGRHIAVGHDFGDNPGINAAGITEEVCGLAVIFQDIIVFEIRYAEIGKAV